MSLTYFSGFHLPAERLPWNIERSALPPVVCYPLRSFFTNRLYHLLGNLPRCHLASNTPVFSHVAICTNRVDRYLSPFSLYLMGFVEEPYVVFLFLFFLIFSVSLFYFFYIKHREGSETKQLSRCLKSFYFIFFFFLIFSIFGGWRGKEMITWILNYYYYYFHLKLCQYSQASFWFNIFTLRLFFKKLGFPFCASFVSNQFYLKLQGSVKLASQRIK